MVQLLNECIEIGEEYFCEFI